MDNVERVYKETRLRNLKRSYAKMINHHDLIEECNEVKKIIHELESELDLQ